MPPHAHDSQLHAILDFYCSVVSVTPEGDTLVSEETLEGLGMDHFRSLFNTLFGSLLRVAFPFDPSRPPSESSRFPRGSQSLNSTDASLNSLDASYTDGGRMSEQVEEIAEALAQTVSAGTPGQTLSGAFEQLKKFKLTDFVPDPGYFLAGAIAGGVSRTATAPLDRLKVYLLVNTGSSIDTAGAALKQGRPIEALKNATRPFRDAVRFLYGSGGISSFFAGTLWYETMISSHANETR